MTVIERRHLLWCLLCCRDLPISMRSCKLSCYARLDHDNYALGSVGDSPEIATELADLVVPEIKRAIANLVRDCGEGRQPMRRPGDFDMILDGDERRPRFI
jgi:uncharacterized protein YhfF